MFQSWLKQNKTSGHFKSANVCVLYFLLCSGLAARWQNFNSVKRGPLSLGSLKQKSSLAQAVVKITE